MDINDALLYDITRQTTFVLLYLLLFLFAKWLKDFLTPYAINHELTGKNNLAVSLCMAGYYFGLVAIFMGALSGPSHGLTEDLLQVGAYSLLGIVFLNVSRYVNDRIILRRFDCTHELTEKMNVAVGAVQFGAYLATGLIAAAAVRGTGGDALTAVVFFILGQLSLFLFSLVYDFITPYCIHEQLEQQNTAVGAALGGTLIALGIIVFNGASGDFISWQVNLTDLVISNLMAFAFLPIVRLMMDKLVIPNANLSDEIIEDKNLGAGLLEATVAISFAIVLVSVV
ncbi:MAG: DUF350 domain-containing protein [Mariprofundaceae bacterium]|nr:DUF350 domain-containing protein [Mariprofundaceae bacterium]